MNVTVTVFHNEDARMFLPYEDGHRLTEVFTYTLDVPDGDLPDPRVLGEVVWANMNRGSNREHPEFMDAPIRSMCVGDVAAFAELETAVAVEPLGFKVVALPSAAGAVGG